MLSSTAGGSAAGGGSVKDLRKPRLVRRFMSSARDCSRWPDPAHFALPCSARRISEVRLTDLVVRGVRGADVVQLRVKNLEQPHLVALTSPARRIQWPVRVARGVAAQAWRTLTGLPAGLVPGTVVEVPGQGLFTVVAADGTSVELDRTLKAGAAVTEVRLAAPLVAAGGRRVTTEEPEDFEPILPGDVVAVGRQRLRVVTRVSGTELELDGTPEWTGAAAYAVAPGPQADTTGALAVLPVSADGECALDQTGTFRFATDPEQTTRVSEIEIQVADAYGELLRQLPHGGVEVELSITEG